MIAAHEDPRPLAIEERLFTAGKEPEHPLRERVGPYRLVRLLGRGGMGEVYLAERDDGEYRDQVAIKLLAGGPGILGGERERRLRQERQILASLRHPGIATLYDGGITDDGQPYLVMEYVDGQPITEYCEEHRLTLRERLELFARVCDAVQYAHARQVVHRDLKPSNLLVTPDGASKLLDFGIAKLLDGAEPTRAEVRVFTPRRAAPEQMRGEPVCTATDVYALGVLLFELLDGRLPFQGEEEPLQVPRELRGDLESILTKALARRPEDRYAAAGFLAEDVRRHLAGEPVQARRQTWAYLSRKLVKRHAFAVALMALAGLALAVMAWFAAGRARQQPLGNLAEAYASNKLGLSLAMQGRHGEAEAAFQRGHDILAARLGSGHIETANALRNVGRVQQLQRRYPEALATLRGASAVFANRATPRQRAGIGYQTARAAWLVEHSPRALVDLRSAARTLADLSPGPLDPVPADAMVALGVTLLEAGQPSEAVEVLQEALDLRLASGKRGPKVIEARCALRLAQEASGARAAPRELRACAATLPGWGMADPELVARFASRR
ncbi:MAG TPA: serine/threonine-protein kinase [Aeromicrobium sp.]|nr:serine/threonine-protein kinase [Aeromicrobium sp.]